MKTVQDLTEKELVVGDTGPGTGTRSYPKALNDILGMKFKIVGGYQSSADVFLAMERGEVQGICESLDSVKVRRPDWIPSGTVSVLFQGGTKPNPELKHVPFVVDLAQKPRRQAGDRVPLRRPGHRTSVHRAARYAGRSAQDAARGVQRDHDRSRSSSPKPMSESSRWIRRTANTSKR